MTTRVIKLKLLTQTELVKVESSARTFGELKSELKSKQINIDFSSAKLIDKLSKASYEVDEAVLPAVDCLMFVMPTKSKAGADLPYKEVKELIKNYKAQGGIVDFNYTQATTAQLNEFWNKVKNQGTLKASKSISGSQTLKKEVVVKESGIPENQLVDTTTLADLDEEAKDLQKKIK